MCVHTFLRIYKLDFIKYVAVQRLTDAKIPWWNSSFRSKQIKFYDTKPNYEVFGFFVIILFCLDIISAYQKLQADNESLGNRLQVAETNVITA